MTTWTWSVRRQASPSPRWRAPGSVRVPINHPFWSGGMLVFVENAAESVASVLFPVGHGQQAQEREGVRHGEVGQAQQHQR
jgi:hypothetical protein